MKKQILIIGLILLMLCPFCIVKAETTSVDLDGLAKIKDQVEELSKIKTVTINDKNDLSNLNLLNSCPNLTDIITTNLSDYSFINYLNKENLSLTITNSTIDFSKLNSEKIKEIYIINSEVKNLNKLTKLSKLQTIFFQSVKGYETINYDELTSLENLSVTGQTIKDYATFFEKIKNVKVLDISDSNFQNKDTIYIKNLTNLTTLNIEGTFVDKIEFLKDLPNLTKITLPYGVKDLSVLTELESLTNVYLDAYTELNLTNEMATSLNGKLPSGINQNAKADIDKIIQSLNITDKMSERQKVEKVTKWVTDNITFEEGTSKGTALDYVLANKKGVCYHYTILEYTILKELGIETYYIEGFANNGTTTGAHAWLNIYVDNNWYAVDPTWAKENWNNNFLKNVKNVNEFTKSHNTYVYPIDFIPKSKPAAATPAPNKKPAADVVDKNEVIESPQTGFVDILPIAGVIAIIVLFLKRKTPNKIFRV